MPPPIPHHHPHPHPHPHPPPTTTTTQVRYFKSLPDSVEGVRRVVARMRGLPHPEELREEADEARQGLLTGAAVGGGSGGRRRRHAPALAAAT
jgi:hypothetical protein